MVRFAIAGVAFTCALVIPIDAAWQVVTMQGGGMPPATNSQPPAKGTGLIVRQVVDGEGRFMFHSIPPGRVSLSAIACRSAPPYLVAVSKIAPEELYDMALLESFFLPR